MPFGNEGLEDLTGLALSGGGFRATLFHLGAFWRLNELGYLPNLDRVSSVSGGSIGRRSGNSCRLLASSCPDHRYVRCTGESLASCPNLGASLCHSERWISHVVLRRDHPKEGMS